MWLVEIVAAILFVGSGTILFNDKFRKNRGLLVCAGIVALVSTAFLTWEVSKLAVRSELAAGGRASEPVPTPSDAEPPADPGPDLSP